MDVDALIATLRGSDSLDARIEAATTLGKVEGREALDALVEGLDAEPGLVAAAAAEALARVGTDDALEPMLAAASDPARSESLFAIVRGLGVAARDRPRWREASIDALVRILDSEDNLAISDAAGVLGELDDDLAVRALADAVAGGVGAKGRAEAVRALGERGVRDARHAAAALTVLERALDDEDEAVSRAAADRLGELPGGTAPLLNRLDSGSVRDRKLAAGVLRAPAAVKPLAAALADHPDVAWPAATSLGEIGDPAAVPALEAALSMEIGTAAAAALAQLGRSGTVALARARQHPDDYVRRRADAQLPDVPDAVSSLREELQAGTAEGAVVSARTIMDLGMREAADALAAAAKRAEPEVVLAALDASVAVGAPVGVKAALRATREPFPELRAAGARALASAGRRPAAEAPLVDLLEDPEPIVRAAAADGLARLGGEAGARDALAAALKDPDPRVRRESARALGSAGAPAVGLLLDTLADPDSGVREAAAAGLARLGSVAHAAVAARLADPRPAVREGAAVALAGSRDPSLDIIDEALASSEVRTRAAAATALGRLDAAVAHQALERLTASLDDPHLEVRSAVFRALSVLPLERLPHSLGGAVERCGAHLLAEDEPVRDDAARALVHLGTPVFVDEPVGPVVAGLLLTALDDRRPGVRASAMRAIEHELGFVEPRTRPFPGWFWVSRDWYNVTVSEHARQLVEVTRREARRNDPEGLVAVSALGTMLRVLADKRAPDALVDEHVAYFMAPPSNTGAPLEEERAAAVGMAEAFGREPRYADVTVFRGGRHASNRLSAGTALRHGDRYELEVAVRAVPTGLATRDPRRPIVEPAADEEVTVLVVAHGEGIKIDEPVQTLILPAKGDSTDNAWFSLRPEVVSTNQALATVELRLYHDLQLLEALRLRAEVVSRLQPGIRSNVGLEQPVSLEQERIVRGFAGIGGDIPRGLHIDVTHDDGTYAFHFTIGGAGEGRQVLVGRKRASAQYLEDRLVRVRRSLDGLALHPLYATEVDGKPAAFHEAMWELAQLGRGLWQDLFRFDPQSALWHIGEQLRKQSPDAEAVIQISLEDSAGDFVFPWGLLYDRDLPEKRYELPDPDGFWALRYSIEQQSPGRQHHGPDELTPQVPPSMAFMFFKQFPNAVQHRSMLTDLANAQTPPVRVSDPPVELPSTCLEVMGDEEREDVVYFFAHGYTRRAATGLSREGHDLARAIYNGLPPCLRQSEELRLAYEAAAGPGAVDQSWLKLSGGTVPLGKLRDELPPGRIAPLVVLNTCESAQMTPSFDDDSFVTFFLRWGARTVIGTECRMTAYFADPMAKSFLEQVLGGTPFGLALLRARRGFIERRNPLGLAYTLYGSATARFASAEETANLTKEKAHE